MFPGCSSCVRQCYVSVAVLRDVSGVFEQKAALFEVRVMEIDFLEKLVLRNRKRCVGDLLLGGDHVVQVVLVWKELK